jgi:hypothetical protein
MRRKKNSDKMGLLAVPKEQPEQDLMELWAEVGDGMKG